VVDPGGLILTSWALVEGYSSALVDLGAAAGDGPRPARLVGVNAFADIALLAVDPPPGRSLPAVALADLGSLPAAGTQVHVLSPTAAGWRHDFAIVVQVKADHSWFSGGNVIHRGAALRLQMSSPPSEDGAAVLSGERELVGLKVHNARGPGQITAVSARTIAPLLAAAGGGPAAGEGRGS
jgi:S1-C subfamily serine protease